MQRKLTTIAVFVGLMVWLLAVLVLGGVAYFQSRQHFEQHLEAQCAVARANLAAALAFDDLFVARETLSAVGRSPAVRDAVLFRPDGTVFASFERSGLSGEAPREPAAYGLQWLPGSLLQVVQPLMVADESAGVLVVTARHESPLRFALSYAGWVVGLLGATVFVVWVVALPFHRRIVRPVEQLLEFLRIVRHRQDFSIRMEVDDSSEPGRIAAEFNTLLDELNVREHDLEQARNRLEGEVRRRTCEHARTNQELKDAFEELKLAKETAESANRSKSQFLARMSHEIRTPMNGVLCMTDLLLQSGLNLRQRNLAETVYRSGEALLHIINDILDFSKIEAGKLELDAVEFSIGELLEQTLELLAEHAQKKGLELIGWMDDSVPVRMEGDPNRLRQVLVNLIGNAIKFTRSGDVSIHVQTLHEANDKVILKFVVSDSGLGIAPDALDRIFDPFSQEDGSTTRKFGGTGLGLAICRQLTLMMGGEIGADSEPGVGSSFWFTACFAHPIHSAGEHVASRDALQGVEALLLTDHRLLRDVLLHRFTSWGMTVKAVKHVEEAIATLRSRTLLGRPYRLVVIDEGASGTSSVMALRMMRSDKDVREFSAVLLHRLTGTADAEAHAAGFTALVRKPAREADLYRALAQGIGRKTAHEVPPSIQMRLARQGLGVRFDADLLVAEDNLVNQEVIRGMLANLGCRVTVVNNGREAVESVKDGRFDLVFMDCQMPDMDGFDATRAIKKLLHPGSPLLPGEELDSSPALPIIALTANAMEGDREVCLSRGMDDYLSKPFRPDQLETVLLRWIPEKQATSDSVERPTPTERIEEMPTPCQWETTLCLASPSGAGPSRQSVDVPPRSAPQPPWPPRGGETMVEDPADLDEPLDRKVLDSIRGVQASGVPDLLKRVVESYLAETPKLIDQLADAVAAGKYSAIRQVAHALKSSSANVGGRRLANACKEIELLTDTALVEFGKVFLREVRTSFEAIQHALKSELEETA